MPGAAVTVLVSSRGSPTLMRPLGSIEAEITAFAGIGAVRDNTTTDDVASAERGWLGTWNPGTPAEARTENE